MHEVRIGSQEHKELFCRWFIDTHKLFDPEDLQWPPLDEESMARLRSVPIWSDALQVEIKAGELVSGFAQSVRDPLVREAVAVQGVEETRHGRMLSAMARHYGLNVTEERLPVTISERAFMDFAYKECMDAFIGFGAFRLARDARFLPDTFFSIFSPFMTEEARHIVFFINWIAYERVRRNRGAAILQAAATAYGYFRALRLLMSTVKSAKNGSGFMGGGTAFADLTLPKVLETCLRENERQMAAFDPRLLRPRVIPTLAKLMLGLVQTSARVYSTR